MPYRHLLGRVSPLRVLRFGPPGAFFAVSDDTAPGAPTVLLPGAEIPEGTKEGDVLDVFVSLDSEDRPIATQKEPKIELGEVAFLKVTDVTDFGAFVDWGLPKELLVPLAEQVCTMHVGKRYPVGLFVDKTGRLAGTGRTSEMLREKAKFDHGEWVDGEVLRDDPEVGLFVIVERRFLGLVPASEPSDLVRGESARFRVARLHADGKIELSVRAVAHEQQGEDAAKILAALAKPNARPLGDRSSPEDIRDAVGLSKKELKRAVGHLLKNREVDVDDDGVVRLRDANRRPPG